MTRYPKWWPQRLRRKKRVPTTHKPAVRRLLEDHVGALNRRMRQRSITALTERVIQRETNYDLYLEMPLAMQLASIALHVAAAVADIEAEDDALVRDFEQLARLYGELRDEVMRREFLESALAGTPTSRWRLRGDLRALDRNFGFDALRERHLRERHEMLIQIEVGLDFVAGALQRLDELQDEAANDLVRNSALLAMVLRRLVRATRWPTKFAIARAASAAAHLGLRPDAAGHARLQALFEAEDEHPWVRAEAVRAFWSYDEALARRLTVHMFMNADEHVGRTFLVRRLLVDRLAERPSEAHRFIPKLFEVPDPSPHVRIGVYLLVENMSDEHPQLVDWLVRACHGSAADPSACARANATRCLIRRLNLALRRADHATTRLCVETITAMCRDDSDDLVVQLICRDTAELWGADLEETAIAQQSLWAELVDVLTDLCGRDDRSPVIQESAATALEAVSSLYDEVRRRHRQILREAVACTEPGGKSRIPLSVFAGADGGTGLNAHDLGRIAAELSRDDWDLDLSVRRGALVLYRGQRFRRRLWRILHELRSFSPNKRQGFLHSVGRVFTGTVRAHSGRLHEVTATTVPGERVQVESEGGWGRHMPTIDDLLSVPVLRSKPVQLFSSYGVTTLRGAPTLARRCIGYLRMTWDYASLSDERIRALSADEPSERLAYSDRLRRQYGLEVDFAPYAALGDRSRRASWRVRSLFPAPEGGTDDGPGAAHGNARAVQALAPLSLPDPEWFHLQKHYFLDLEGNSQAALAVFLGVLCSWFITDSLRRRISIDKARKQIPLSIGGWGTRGKSGTERLKAGLFHGLGYRVFSKTTGCEAMFIHSVPEGQAEEVFVFRPYSKATIWEQRDLLQLGAALGCDVFLWECMALNPRYVEILAHLWMRDDLATITNTYPDHEDIQGPAGYNVAETICKFVPKKSTVITSETNFLPMIREAAKRNETKFVALDDFEDKLIPPDLLELFPYQEHPRNIALVTKMATELGVDRELAIVTMAEAVVPDLGVLKSYPVVRLFGRDLQFINGCSANERAGFLNNWRRTGCDKVDATLDEERILVTVVNNRADRVSRSEVFARILVGDVACDRHVLIGTNIQGLVGYIEQALGEFLESLQIINDKDSNPIEAARRRLKKLLGKVRTPEATAAVALRRLAIYARGADLEVGDAGALEPLLQTRLRTGDPISLAKVRRALDEDRELGAALDAALRPAAAPRDNLVEVLEPAKKSDVVEHFYGLLAKMMILARLDTELLRLKHTDAEEVGMFEARVREAYAELFRAAIIPVWNADTTGDQIAALCARSVPPGTQVTLMGTQNIKGTGLDFVYRWLSVDYANKALDDLRSARPQTRIDALVRLEQYEDHGLMDLGMLRGGLRRHQTSDPSEAAVYQRVLHKVDALYEKKQNDLGSKQDTASTLKRFSAWLEGWVEFLDGAARFHRSRAIVRDLVDQRMSHPRAAVLMRELYAREKGGWIYKRLAKILPQTKPSLRRMLGPKRP